jgi:hypothetical protein
MRSRGRGGSDFYERYKNNLAKKNSGNYEA